MRVYSVFQLLTDVYKDNTIKLQTFLYTMKSMLEDRVATESGCTYNQYLLDIVNSYLMDELPNQGGDNQGAYVAPNCKEYEIKYNEDRQAYYSPDFIRIHYFISTDAIESFISKYNP
ncbi:MAG: hypothetical protein GXP45_06915 [bacterium]|nr:hypothetical protein [bacterium]